MFFQLKFDVTKNRHRCIFFSPWINHLWNNNFICGNFLGGSVLLVWFFFLFTVTQPARTAAAAAARWLPAPLSVSFSPRLRSIAPAGITHREAFKSDPTAAAQKNKGVGIRTTSKDRYETSAWRKSLRRFVTVFFAPHRDGKPPFFFLPSFISSVAIGWK